MIIRQLELKNWGPYRGYTRIDFPEPTSARRIHLIRGENGNGKTHLLRAMIICLHGAQGMDIVDPNYSGRQSDKQRLNEFLKTALTHGAEIDASGAPQMTLGLTLYDGAREYKITRQWWFDGRDEDPEESLIILVDGESPGFEETAREELEDEKANLIQSIIPSSVTKFFFFDGEEIKSIAERDPQQAVSEGLDALLGFQILSDLQRDIGAARSKLVNSLSDSNRDRAEMQKLEAEIASLDVERFQKEEAKKDLQRDIDDYESTLQGLRRRLPGGGAVTSIGGSTKLGLIDELKKLQGERDNSVRQLSDVVGADLSLALNGFLLGTTRKRLRGERALRNWQSQRDELEPECEKLSERLLGEAAPQPNPSLSADQRTFLRDRLREEWKLILHPPPEGVPTSEWFTAYSGDALGDADRRLAEIENAPSDRVTTLVQNIRDADRSIGKLEARISNFDDDQSNRATYEEIEELSRKIGSLEKSVEDIDGRLADIDAEVSKLRRDQSLKVNRQAKSEELNERLKVTDNLDEVIRAFRDQLKAERISELEASIQQMMVQLAHKGEDQFNRIQIDPKSFRLVVRDADGIDVDQPSAGEQEILALSMIWALGKISRRDLPLVIDTPLGRLDRRHRDNIVHKFLPQAADQVIVLATDSEITDDRRIELAASLAGELEVVFDNATRQSAVRPMEPVR